MGKESEVLFDAPVYLQLEGYAAEQRVLGVAYCKNPYGYGRKLRSYAIAEMRRGDGPWRTCSDPATRMRLANLVEHPFPKNLEPWANKW